MYIHTQRLRHTRARSSARGFTLLEIMVTVAIIALVGAIAVPSFLRSYKNAVSGRVSNDLNVYRGAIDVYHAEHSAYPNEGDVLLPGSFPSDLADGDYIESAEVQIYENIVPLVGGKYQFDYDPTGGSAYKAAIVIANTVGDDQLLELIDAKLDDENLASGDIQKDGYNLIWIIE